MGEPTVEIYHRRTASNRLALLIGATRPAFLTASVLPVLVAGALVRHLEGHVSPLLLALASINVALIHSGANVLNDYFDGVSGNDDRNTGRVFPFSGGSRFIQNKILTLSQTRNLAIALLAAGSALGLVSVWLAGPLLLLIGMAGAAIAVTYSAPPCLACRGLGDVAIALAFGVLPVAGTTWLLMHAIPVEAWWAGAVVGCFVAAILWANSIPDIEADLSVGKATLPARLGASAAAKLLSAWFIGGAAILIASPLPMMARLALVALVPAVMAGRAAIQGRLEQALPATIGTHAAVCVLLIVGLLLAV